MEGREHVGAAFPGGAPCSERSPLGCHSKKKRAQISRRLTTAAVPALAGVAAVLCFSPQALASPLLATHAAVDRTTAANELGWRGQSPGQLLSASQRAMASKPGQPAKYTVPPGDSPSPIPRPG